MKLTQEWDEEEEWEEEEEPEVKPRYPFGSGGLPWKF